MRLLYEWVGEEHQQSDAGPIAPNETAIAAAKMLIS
jgi:hypothetical protein